MLKRVVHNLGRGYIERVVAGEYADQAFTAVNERPIEYAFALQWLNRLQPTTVLDTGTGTTAFPALLRTCGFLVTAIDNVKDYWSTGMHNRHWQILHDDLTSPSLQRSYDAVTCISVLEHIDDPLAAVRGLHRLTRPGGHVILTTPYGAVGHRNVYVLAGSYGTGQPYICRQSTVSDLHAWLSVGFSLQADRYWRAFKESEYWSVGERLRPIEATDFPAHLGCFVLRRD